MGNIGDYVRRGAPGLLTLPVEVRPLGLEFHDAGHGAIWLIDRKVTNGRYRWTARLRFDGERRNTRRRLLAEDAARRAHGDG